MKICKGCQSSFPPEAFTRNRRYPDGLDPCCRNCTRARNKARPKPDRSAYHRAYRQANKSRIAEAQSEYRERNKDKLSEQNRQYRAEHKESLIEYCREWRKHHKPNRSAESLERRKKALIERYHNDEEFRERRKAAERTRQANIPPEIKREKMQAFLARNPDYRRKYREAHAERIAARMQEWRGRNPEYQRTKNHEYRHRRFGGGDTFISDRFIDQLYKWQDNRCWACGEQMSNSHISHIVPLSRGGQNSPENIALFCQRCNGRLSSKIISHEWPLPVPNGTPKFFNPTASAELAMAMDGRLDDGVIWIGSLPVVVLSSFYCSLYPEQVNAEAVRRAQPDAILVWDSEWYHGSWAVLNVLKAKAGISKTIGARTCSLESISWISAKEFLDFWHLQGSGPSSSIMLGLINDGDLVGVATFSRRSNHLELNRLAFRGIVVGGFGRIVSHLKQETIVSYCDPRFGSAKGYLDNGFDLIGLTPERQYGYVGPAGMMHRLKFSRTMAPRWMRHYDASKSETGNALAHGYRKIHGLRQMRLVRNP